MIMTGKPGLRSMATRGSRPSAATTVRRHGHASVRETILQPRPRVREERKRSLSSVKAGPLSIVTDDSRSSPVELQSVATVREAILLLRPKVREEGEREKTCRSGLCLCVCRSRGPPQLRAFSASARSFIVFAVHRAYVIG